MRIILDGEQEIRIQAEGERLEIESAAPDIHFTPLHMLAASLAACTFSVLATWAMQAGLRFDDLELGLTWTYVDDPYRVGAYDLSIRWASLPPDRRPAAERVALHCTVENTLTVPPEIRMEIEG